MNESIFFSILIPAYKSQFFSAAIESILLQTYQNWELVIVDDHSPEDLKSVVDSFADNRIRYYRNEKNYGAVDVVDNWNKCLSYAKGDYVICIGDDDILPDRSLENYKELIDRYPSIKVYHGRTELIDEEGKSLALLEPREEVESPLALAYYRWKGRYQYIGDFCYEVNALKEQGGFFKLPLAWSSDDISAVRQAALDDGIANSNIVLFKYRINRLSITSSGSIPIKLEAIKLEEEWYESFLHQYSVKRERESAYLQYLYTMKDAHFLKKKLSVIVSDISIRPSRFFFWLNNRKKYCLSFKMVVYVLLMGIIDRGKEKNKNRYYNG